MKFEQLEQLVIKWADEKGIFEQSTAEKQKLKCLAEIGELGEAISQDNTEAILNEIGDIVVCLINANHFVTDINTSECFKLIELSTKQIEKKEIILNLRKLLAIQIQVLSGQSASYDWDFLSILDLIAHIYNTDLESCLELAYNKISKRKGQMINGLFVKEKG